MEVTVNKVNLNQVQPLRDLFLAEVNFQFVYNKCHAAGWADTYLFTIDGEKVGYGSVWGKDKREERDAIFEFYLLEPWRKIADVVFPEFHKVSGASFVECQTNDRLLTDMLFEYCANIYADRILFEDSFKTDMNVARTIFKKTKNLEGDTEYVLDQDGNIVATGGFVWNYNFPYIDIYYEVKENHRKNGFGSLITQELKKEAYLLHRVPAARCNIGNKASKATLLKAGMKVCGHILIGELENITSHNL
jgi:RimJ/RimL family protein N-acetyltransferase